MLLLALPVALLLAAMFPGAAVAAEPTSGYGQTTTTPPTKTTPTTKTTPPSSAGTAPKSSSGTSAANESTTTTAAKEAAPTATTSATSSTKESTLPFTGLDLRWVIGIGLLIIAAGFSLLWVQRRQRGGSDHSTR
jgi:hypothetical protein